MKILLKWEGKEDEHEGNNYKGNSKRINLWKKTKKEEEDEEDNLKDRERIQIEFEEENKLLERKDNRSTMMTKTSMTCPIVVKLSRRIRIELKVARRLLLILIINTFPSWVRREQPLDGERIIRMIKERIKIDKIMGNKAAKKADDIDRNENRIPAFNLHPNELEAWFTKFDSVVQLQR